jgi:Rieske Fe-S protein
MNEPQGRRRLLRSLLLLPLAPLGVLWHRVASERAGRAPAAHRVPAPHKEGLFFHGPVILRRQGERITALSSRCPHLGCQIDRLDGEALVCPCHGSRFSTEGRLLAGPAREGLATLTHRRERGAETLVVSLRE